MHTAITGLGERDLRAHMTWLRRLAARLVSPSSADDAVQATLLAAVEHTPSLDRDLRPWLARVLANFAHDARRSEGRRQTREAAAIQNDVGAAPAADQLLERHEAARVVAGLVSRLREPHRTLVLLRFAEGVAPVDIARRRGLAEGTVRRQLKEAVDQLRAGVTAHYGDGRRDWRMALAPLAGMSPGRVVRPWEEVLWMTAKTKIGLAVAAVLLLAAQGVSGGKVVVLVEGDTADPTAETELRLRLSPAGDGGAPGRETPSCSQIAPTAIVDLRWSADVVCIEGC